MHEGEADPAPIEAPESQKLLAELDRDRALCLPFTPQAQRGALAALYAFDIETARIRDLVSQPLPGEIRLQWWRDLIGSGAAGGSGHPVADELLAVIERHQLPRHAFERFLDARIFDLYDDPFPATADLEAYAGETRSTLIMLAATVLSRNDADRIADPAGHAGVALTVAHTLRTLPLSRSRGQCLIPLDLLNAVGCSAQDLIKGEAEPAGRAIAAFAAFGLEHDAKWRGRLSAIPKSVRSAFLPASLSELILDRAAKEGAGCLDRAIEIGPLRKSFRYWRTMRG